MSALVQIFLNDFSINQIRSSAYHRQTNGAYEHFNGTLKSMLRSLTEKLPNSWDTALPCILFAYREVPVETLGCSPFDLLFGRSVAGFLSLPKSAWLQETDLRGAKQNVVEFILGTREGPVMLSMLLRSTRSRSVLEQNAGMTVEHVSRRSSQETKSLL